MDNIIKVLKKQKNKEKKLKQLLTCKIEEKNNQ
jgi:hypothetical protein